jgi:hypothetical protein
MPVDYEKQFISVYYSIFLDRESSSIGALLRCNTAQYTDLGAAVNSTDGWGRDALIRLRRCVDTGFRPPAALLVVCVRRLYTPA